MAKVRIFYDDAVRTLSVWIGDPSTEDVCEEIGDDTVVIKDAAGRVIGFEKLNVPPEPGDRGLMVELAKLPDPPG